MRQAMRSGRRAVDGRRECRRAALSAICERHLTSRLFSPHSTARPTTEYAWALRGFAVTCSWSRHLLLADYLWMRETAEARPVLAWRGL
jgi:hypothetical protein